MNKLSKDDVIKQLEEMAVDGKLTFEQVAELVYNPDVPEDFFNMGHQLLLEGREEDKRYKELVNQISEIIKLRLGIANELVVLAVKSPMDDEKKKELLAADKYLKSKIEPIETEFAALKEKIEKRKGI